MSCCFVCSNTNCSPCQHCQNVLLCQAHYYIHHNEQENICWPFQIASKAGIGRCLIASRNIAAGEKILTELSAASGPRDQDESFNTICVQCFAISYFKCKCGLNLCRVHLSSHGQQTLECGVLEKSAYFDYKTKIQVLTPLRLWFAQMHDRDLALRCDLLMDHNDDSFEKEGDLRLVQVLSNIISEDYSRDFHRLIGLLKTNAIQVSTNGHARALFPTFSFLSHSCITNARHVIQQEGSSGQFSLKLYSQVDIKKGEEIKITYTSLLRPTLERREKLEYLWHFICQCSRCRDPSECGTGLGDVKCPQCLKPMTINIEAKSYHCHCQVIKHSSVQSLTSQLEDYLNGLNKDADSMQSFLDYTTRLLSENHYLRLIAKRYLSQLLPVANEKKLELCLELLSTFDKLDPGLSHSRGMTLYEVFKVTQQREIVSEIISCLKMEPAGSLAAKACEKLMKM